MGQNTAIRTNGSDLVKQAQMMKKAAKAAKVVKVDHKGAIRTMCLNMDKAGITPIEAYKVAKATFPAMPAFHAWMRGA